MAPNDRALIAGMTQFAGKTYLVRHLAAALPSVIGYDVKGDLDIANVKVVDRLDRVYGEPRVVLRPPRYRAAEWGELCAYVMARKHTTLIDNDAAVHFAEKGVGVIDPHHLQLVILGQDPRRFGVGLWSLVQGLNNSVHLAIIKNSWTVIAFRLPLKEDRDRLRGIVGDKAELAGTLPKHWFLYYRQGMAEPIVCDPIGGPMLVTPASKVRETVRDSPQLPRPAAGGLQG